MGGACNEQTEHFIAPPIRKIIVPGEMEFLSKSPNFRRVRHVHPTLSRLPTLPSFFQGRLHWHGEPEASDCRTTQLLTFSVSLV